MRTLFWICAALNAFLAITGALVDRDYNKWSDVVLPRVMLALALAFLAIEVGRS